jgi:hypothetical protein
MSDSVIAYELRRLRQPNVVRSPRVVLRRWWWVFVMRWETEICCRCGRPVARWIGSWWQAPDDLWMEVVGDETAVWCPRCFTERADELGIWTRWEAVRDE